jgi:alpha-1,6-mannosyltransferase
MNTTEPPGGQDRSTDGAASSFPFWALVAALVGLTAFFLIRPAVQDLGYYRPRPGGRTFDFWYLVLAAFLPYAWALVAARRGMRVPAPLLFGAAAVLYTAMIPAPPQQSQDVYQYLVYGRMAAEGISPYAVLPNQVPNGWLAFAVWRDTASIYGPVWTAVSHLAVVATGSLTGALLFLKAVAAGLALAATAGLYRSDPERGPWAAVAFAFSPLVLVSAGLGAHADVAVAAAFAWAIVAERRGRPWLTTGLLLVATLVKLYAGLALAVWLIALARRRGFGRAALHGVVAVTAAVAAFVPYWGGADSFRGFAEIGTRTSTSLLGALIRLGIGDPASASTGSGSVVMAARVVMVAVLLGGLLWVIRSRDTPEQPWRAAATLSVLYLLVTPWYLYWHLLGALTLALAAAEAGVLTGVLVFSGTSLLVVATPFATGHKAVNLVLQTAARYGIPIAAGLRTHRRYTRGRDHPGAGSGDGGLPGGRGAPRGARTAEGPRRP